MSVRGWLLCACALLTLPGVPVRAADPPSEYRVKAVFLFNFAQFVEWPSAGLNAPTKPFVIGILGKDPFGSDLDAVVRGETVAQKPLVVERYHSVADLQDCNILYIARTEIGHLPQILSALKGRSILTVSDADGGDQTGVMIRLVNQNNRIRMQIDVGAAKAANLTISSKLLRPAEIVGGAQG
jgi:YfiR/HmsC-like